MTRLAAASRRLARAAAIGGLLAVAAGCGTASPSQPATPTGPPVLGLDWGRATSVEAPKNYAADLTYNGVHPMLRIPGQAMISDVTPLPAGGFVAVGYVPPDWLPAAWTSTDGQTWSSAATACRPRSSA